MKIGNFNVSKKALIVIGVLVVIIIISSLVSKKKHNDEVKRQQAEALANQQQKTTEATTEREVPDTKAMLQEKYRELYGEPPVGFEWDATGNLIALGNNEEMTAEDVVYVYIRALSILDFATAQRYSSQSYVTDTYNDYYSAATAAIVDYYSAFSRKQYKYALTSIELLDVADTAVFADGTEMVTLNIKVCDLTNKDFWKADKETLFETLREYDEFEADETKKNQYIYDYIYQAYEDGKAGKRVVPIEIVLSKENASGWLVSNDKELDAVLGYDWGNDVANYINQEYTSWLITKRVDEQKQEVEDKRKEIESQKNKSTTETDATEED